MAFTTVPAEGKTCTVRVGLHGEVCGEPAVLAFRRGEEGAVFAECAAHAAPLPAGTKAAAPFAPGARVRVTHIGIAKVGTVTEVRRTKVRVEVPLAAGTTKVIERRIEEVEAI